jgi:RNA polymerase sigma-70 factor, ECF subfamily
VRGRTWCRIDAEQRFTELYDANYRRVLAYARSRIGPQAAEELTSETFLVVWARLDEVPGAVVPWLLGITRNLVRERRRAVGRQAELAAALDLTTRAADLLAGDVADQVVERAAALRALASLSDADRETLTLVAWHGLPPREAARLVGCSQAAFWVRLHRARQRLERAIDVVLPAAPDPYQQEADADAQAQT